MFSQDVSASAIVSVMQQAAEAQRVHAPQNPPVFVCDKGLHQWEVHITCTCSPKSGEWAASSHGGSGVAITHLK